MDFLLTLATIAPLLSILCSIALWATWCIMPRWRTLQNYISVNQITTGALQLCSPWLIIENSYLYALIFSDIWLLVSIIWSFSSTLLAYFKLVLLNNDTLIIGKLNVSIFVYGLTFSIQITSLVTKYVYNIEYLLRELVISFFVLLIITLMIVLLIRIIMSVMSCCKTAISTRNSRHVLSLIGVALICDTGTVLWLLLSLFPLSNNTFMDCWYFLRLIPQTLFILFNASSRAHWKWYFNRRRRMNMVV